MTERLSESAIVFAVAKLASERITRKVIKELQQMTVVLSGDDSELKNPWDEICAQIQFEQSIHWEAYDETVKSMVGRHISELSAYEREAIWHQTNAGIDWHCDEPADREPYYELDEDVIQHVTSEYVYAEAGRWSNGRIRAFFDRLEDD